MIDPAFAYTAAHKRAAAAIARLQAAIASEDDGMFVIDAPCMGDAEALAAVADSIEDAEADYLGEHIVYRVLEHGFALSTWHDEDEAEIEAARLVDVGRDAVVECCNVGTVEGS